MTHKGRRQKLKSGDEWDMVYAKQLLCYLGKSGVAKVIKKILNRRDRQDAKKELRERE